MNLSDNNLEMTRRGMEEGDFWKVNCYTRPGISDSDDAPAPFFIVVSAIRRLQFPTDLYVVDTFVRN
uniref:Uncharacterized protein n=1 Tax=Caenorhabditis tropicalis TaxID=1561998 RepID=A0A1I7UCI6_9PELO